MSNLGTLWTTLDFNKATRLRAVAAYGRLSIDVPAEYKHFEDNKKPEFLAKFPHGKIPAFEGQDGFKLFETAAIARYFASLAPNSGLLGTSPQEAALIDQWVSVADTELHPNVTFVNLICRGYIQPYSKPMYDAHIEKAVRAIKTLETHLTTRTFFVGERITLADITIAATLQTAYKSVIDPALRAETPNLLRFFNTVVNQESVRAIYGETTFCDAKIQYTPPAKEKKEPKPQAEQPKKEKKPKAKEADDDEEDEPLVPEEPKAKNPLDSLPKSTLNLEDWKRAYSNLDTRGAGGSIEWLYKNFDKEGYSLWRVDFKYNEELTQTFMSSNQIGGFFNRLEASRKYLFGSVGVLGKANASVISGTFIARGQDIQPVVDVAPDWESYAYKKLDLENAEDKAFFEAALAWDLEIDGKAWVDGKNFK